MSDNKENVNLETQSGVIDYALIAYLLPHKNRRFDVVKLCNLAAKNSTFVWAGEEVYLKNSNPEVECWILMITDDCEYLNSNFDQITKQYMERGYHRSELFPNVPIDNSPPLSTMTPKKTMTQIKSDCLCTRPCRHGEYKAAIGNSAISPSSLPVESEEQFCQSSDLQAVNELKKKLLALETSIKNKKLETEKKMEEMDKRINETESAFKQLLSDYDEVLHEKHKLLDVLTDARLKLETGMSKIEGVAKHSNMSSPSYHSDLNPFIKYYDGRRELKSALTKLLSVENKSNRDILEVVATTPESSDHELRIDCFESLQEHPSSSSNPPTFAEDVAESSAVVSTTKSEPSPMVPSGPSSRESSLTTHSSSPSCGLSDNEIKSGNSTGLKRKRYSKNASFTKKYYEDMEEELTDDDDDLDGELVVIGDSGHTKIQKSVFNNIKSKKYSVMTRVLLKTLFSRETLATSSMTGKMSPAFLNSDKKPRKPLDAVIVQDIVQCVTKFCNVPSSVVRAVITTKCADEYKMLKIREKKMGKENFFK